MKKLTFADAEYAGKRKAVFLIEMDQEVPCKGLIALIEPHYPTGECGRSACSLMAMQRVNWFGYSDPAVKDAFYETSILRQFSGLSLERILDETTILDFRRLLEKHELAAGFLGVINDYLVAAACYCAKGPSSMPRWSMCPVRIQLRKATSITSGLKCTSRPTISQA